MRRVKPQGGWETQGVSAGGLARAASLWAGQAWITRGVQQHGWTASCATKLCPDHCTISLAEDPAMLAELLLLLPQVITESSHILHASTAAAPNAAAPAALAAGVGDALGLAGQDMQLLVAEV